MRITIEIDESCVTRWGTIIILDPLHGPKEAGIALPGFEYKVKKDKPVFLFDWSETNGAETAEQTERPKNLKEFNHGERLSDGSGSGALPPETE